jgi:tetratricopeptide (TPR) repeat protein
MKEYWTIATLIIFLTFSNSAFGQDKSILDSLNFELAKKQADTSRIKTLLSLAKNYSRSDSKKAFEYIDQAKEIAKNTDVDKEMGDIYYTEGKAYTHIANDQKAMELYQKAMKIYLKLDNVKMVATMYLELGVLYLNKSDYITALDNYSKALEQYKKIGYNNGMARCYGSMGNLYTKQNDYEKGIEYQQKALNLTTEKADKANMYINISANYYYLGEYERSLLYFDSIVPIYKEVKNYIGLSTVYTNFGNTYRVLKKYDKARDYYKTSMNYAQQVGNSAKLLYAQSSLSELYLEINQPDSAIELLDQGLETNKQLGFGELDEIMLRDISLAYEKKGDIKSALEYYKQYKVASDIAAKKLSDKKLLDIQTQWEVEKKDEQIKLLDKEKQLAKQKVLIYGIGSIALLILGISIFIYKQYKNREKQLLLQVKVNEASFKIDLKNRELIYKAMLLSQQEQTLTNIKEELLNINVETSASKEFILRMISDIDLQLKQNTMDDFEKYFIEVHPTFYSNLKEKYPELAPAEMKVCALLRLNLNSKDIASITHKTTRSVETIRTNIRKKMGLTKENLYEVIADV